MSSDRRTTIGRIGERLAAERLEAGGYRIVERNYRTREGELDVIARRGETLVFCEVKTLVARRPGGRGPAYPLESVRHAKRTKIRRLARAWMGERSGTVVLQDRALRRHRRNPVTRRQAPKHGAHRGGILIAVSGTAMRLRSTGKTSESPSLPGAPGPPLTSEAAIRSLAAGMRPTETIAGAAR